VPDHRKRRTYEVAEIIMAGLMMFVFKRGSKHNTDALFTENFADNYVRLFGLKLPVMETVNQFLKKLPPSELENLKRMLVKKLIEKRVLDKFRYSGRLVVAIDGTGVFSFDHEPFAGCPYKVSKNGKKTWQAGLLEAKIICSNGFSISMETEWYRNSDNIDQKQDCEQKAFERLAQKIKNNYPRLALTLVADSLYPQGTFFNTCKANNWNFILTFKEGCLKSIWEEVNSLYLLEEGKHKQFRTLSSKFSETSMFINNLMYHQSHNLHWCEYVRTYAKSSKKERFVHITNISINKDNVWDISYFGRLRWKIENEGFNIQKRNGYRLQHKYAEKDFVAMQNYYQLLQIAHLINQLVEKSQKIATSLKAAGRTIKAIWEDATATMLKETIHLCEAVATYLKTRQIRY
jgi:hypothetical protein